MYVCVCVCVFVCVCVCPQVSSLELLCSRVRFEHLNCTKNCKLC